MVFKKTFQSRSTPASLTKGRFNYSFDNDELNNNQDNVSSEQYRKRIRNHLISQLSFGDHELMERWPGQLTLNKYSQRKYSTFSIQEEYEQTNLVLVNVKNLEKRDFYAENRAKLDLENFLPSIIVQWQDAKDKHYKEILSDLAQQVCFIEIDL